MKTKTKKQNKMIFFDKEEKKLSDYIEKSDLKSVSEKDKKKMLMGLSASAKNTLSKRKVVNLRLSERDLQNLKIKAAEEGIPYQTLMISILHKYLSGKIA